MINMFNEIAGMTGKLGASTRTFLKKNLGLKCTVSLWIPHMLINEQKEACVKNY